MEAARANRRNPRGHLGQRLLPGGSLSRPSLPRRCHPMALDSATRWSSFHRSCPSCLRLVTLLERNGRYTQRLIEESPPGVAVNVATETITLCEIKRKNKNKKKKITIRAWLLDVRTFGRSLFHRFVIGCFFLFFFFLNWNKAHTVMKLTYLWRKSKIKES